SVPRVVATLFACSLTCLAQHPGNPSERDSASGSSRSSSSNSAGSSVAGSSSNPGSSSSHVASPSNNSAGASSPAASSSNSGDRNSQESRNGQAQERPHDRNPEPRSGVPHSKPEAPKPQAPKPLPPAAHQKTSSAQQLPVGNQVLQQKFEACRKDGGHIFNGVCVASIPEAQGYGRNRNLEVSQCKAEERVRIANL